MAVHLDCAEPTLASSKPKALLQRQGDGFPLYQIRVAYLRHLKRQRRRSQRAAPVADLASAQAMLLRIRTEEKQRESDVKELPISLCGVVLTHLWVVFEVRTEIAPVCLEMADECGEPPVD